MQYDKQDLIQKVIAEATKLREHATAQELDKLNFYTLEPRQGNLCIYGQMTGLCFSDRATKLINKCANPFSRSIEEFDIDGMLPKRFLRKYVFPSFTPIEFYIAQPGAKNEALIEFLKGERETLTPQDLKF